MTKIALQRRIGRAGEAATPGRKGVTRAAAARGARSCSGATSARVAHRGRRATPQTREETRLRQDAGRYERRARAAAAAGDRAEAARLRRCAGASLALARWHARPDVREHEERLRARGLSIWRVRGCVGGGHGLVAIWERLEQKDPPPPFVLPKRLALAFEAARRRRTAP